MVNRDSWGRQTSKIAQESALKSFYVVNWVWGGSD